MNEKAQEIKKELSRSLLNWYRRNKRNLPWRETTEPYHIWISEIMLQQTQVDTVIPYYHRFLKAFPNVRALALAPLEAVLKCWENLGYYSRARNLHAAAKMIVREFDGGIPDTPEEIRKLPGIGPYSAGAILSIAYGKPYPAVDGNIRRILSRVFAIEKPMDEPRHQKTLYDMASLLIPIKNPGDFNQALMDLGATICKPKNPNCSACPVKGLCVARRSDLQNLLPIMRKTPRIPHRSAACAVIWNSAGKLLVVRRPATGLLASLWKLPGGFVDPDEKIEDALSERVKEELGISIRVLKKLAFADHAYTHFRQTLFAFDCRLLKGTPEALNGQDWRWIAASHLKKLPMSKIDRMILACIGIG